MPQLEDRLSSTAVKGIQDLGEAIFYLSQRYVPVDKGFLKKSGVFRRLPNGFEIVYRTPYAAAVHFGVPEHDERVRQHWVRTYSMRPRPAGPRRVKARTVLVHGHYRGPFIRHMHERLPRPWLQDAVDELYPKLGEYIRRRMIIEFRGY
jgi:hypothetical protein